MRETSAAYRAAVTGDRRRMLLRAVVDISDPDIAYGAVRSGGESRYSKSAQLHDKDFSNPAPYATLERGRWALDGTWEIYPDRPADLAGEVGFQGDALSGEDGAFSPAAWVEQPMTNVSILQACSVWFPENGCDGVAADFTVEVLQGGTAYYAETFTGNTASHVSLTGFTVHDPDCIRVTVRRWSLPGRRVRIVEIVPGTYESWGGDIIASFDLKQQGNFSCLALPYGTCTLRMDNLDRRFEPRSKDGLFQSIEERQGIDVSIGVALPDGTEEYKRMGVFYQYSGGWRTGDNGLTMQWDLVDIVGLLADRAFLPPSALPTTLAGWLAALAAQLGPNFADRWKADPGHAALPVTCRRTDVEGRRCGDILRWVCLAAGVWPRADAATGFLTAEPLWSQGNRLDLDNLTGYPVMKANDDLAAILFTLHDGDAVRQYVVSGNATASSATVSVDDPFLHTEAQALAAARLILSCYGGNRLETAGRGDPAGEIGDVDTVWLNESTATTARRMAQTLGFSGGVLQNCQSTLLQADGSFLFQERAVLTRSGTWTAPAGVTRLRVILGAGGQGGRSGAAGTWEDWGADGADGHGGRVWTGAIDINDGQTFPVRIGAGGSGGALGGDTVFGAYSSAEGAYYDPSYTDVAGGDAFARTGVEKPLGNGDGGQGGAGGEVGYRHRSEYVDGSGNTHHFWVVDAEPQPGKAGALGGDGFVVVYWDKEGA